MSWLTVEPQSILNLSKKILEVLKRAEMSYKYCTERNLICSALLVICITNVAACMVLKQEAQNAQQPIIKYFGLQENSIAYIGSTINLTCIMDIADVGIFLKSGVPVKEGGRFTYMFEGYGDEGLVGNLQIEGVVEADEGLFTCYAYKAGLTVTKTFTLQVPYPKDHSNVPVARQGLSVSGSNGTLAHSVDESLTG